MVILTITNPWKIVGSLYQSRRCLTSHVMLYLCKNQIRLKIEYCYCSWDSLTFQPYLPPLCHRHITRLLLHYHYFYGKCPNEHYCLVPPLQIFAAKIHLATSTCFNHPHFPCIALIRRMSEPESISFSFASPFFSPFFLPCETDSHMYTFLNTMIIAQSWVNYYLFSIVS